MQRRLPVILLLIVLLAAGLIIWQRVFGGRPKIDRAPMIGQASGIGMVLADETLTGLPANAKLVLVTDYDHKREPRRRDYRWEVFREELRRRAPTVMQQVEIVQADPSEGLPGCPSAAFRDLLERHADADVLVFFVDPPDWAQIQARLPSRRPGRILAVESFGHSLRNRFAGYFVNNFLTALIASNGGPPSGGPLPPRNPREWFDLYYRVYTPQNYETLPE